MTTKKKRAGEAPEASPGQLSRKLKAQRRRFVSVKIERRRGGASGEQSVCLADEGLGGGGVSWES